MVRHFGSQASAFVRVSVFGESRDNGTPLQTNDTDLQELQAGRRRAARRRVPRRPRVVRHADLSGRASPPWPRTGRARALTRLQDVPTTWAGGSPAWSRTFAAGHGFVGGFEARHVDGRSDETVFAQGRATSQMSAGGEQTIWAVFGEVQLALGGRFLARLGARYDRWTETDGFSRTQALVGALPTETLYDDRSARSLSPRASAAVSRGRARAVVRLGATAPFAGPPSTSSIARSGSATHSPSPTPSSPRSAWAGGELGGTWTSKGEGTRVRVVGFARSAPRSRGERHLALDPRPDHQAAAEPGPHALFGPRSRCLLAAFRSRPGERGLCVHRRHRAQLRRRPGSGGQRPAPGAAPPRHSAIALHEPPGPGCVAPGPRQLEPVGRRPEPASPGRILHPRRAGLAAVLAGGGVRGRGEPDRRPLRGGPHPRAHPRPAAAFARRCPLRALSHRAAERLTRRSATRGPRGGRAAPPGIRGHPPAGASLSGQRSRTARRPSALARRRPRARCRSSR